MVAVALMLLLASPGQTSPGQTSPGQIPFEKKDDGREIARLDQLRAANWSLKVALPRPAAPRPAAPRPAAKAPAGSKTPAKGNARPAPAAAAAPGPQIGLHSGRGDKLTLRLEPTGARLSAFNVPVELSYSSEPVQHLECWSLDGTLTIRWNGVVKASLPDNEATAHFWMKNASADRAWKLKEFAFSPILANGRASTPAYVPFVPGKRTEKVVEAKLLAGYEDLPAPAVPYKASTGELRLGLVGDKLEVAVQPGTKLAFLPTWTEAGTEAVEYAVFGGGRQLKVLRIAKFRAPLSPVAYDVTAQDVPSQRMRSYFVDRRGKQNLAQSIDLWGTKALPKLAVAPGADDRYVASVEGATVDKAYLFAGTRFLGATSVKDGRFELSTVTLPVGQYDLTAIVTRANLVYPPLDLHIEAKPRVKIELVDRPDTFVVPGLGSSAVVRVNADRSDIAQIRLFLDGRFVAESAGGSLERAVLLNDIPTGEIEFAVQVTDKAGRSYAVETIRAAVRNDMIESALAEGLRRQRLQEAYETIGALASEAQYWIEKALAEPAMRTYTITDFYSVRTGDGKVISSARMTEFQVPGRAREYLDNAQACLAAKAKWLLVAAQLEKALGNVERARRNCEEIYVIAPNSYAAQQARQLFPS